MSGNDLDRETQASGLTQITGRNELYKAAVLAPDEYGVERLAVQIDGKATVPSIGTSLRIIQQYDVEELLDDVTYFDIYTSGPASVSGFQLKFTDKKVWVRLEIDGVEIFDINVEKFKDISNLNASIQAIGTYLSWHDGTKIFSFTPNIPVTADVSVKVQARSKTGASKRYRDGIIQVG